MKGFLLSVLMLLTSLSAFSSQELPLEYFIKHGDYLDLALSPSGKHIAARVQVDGRVFLVLLKTEDMSIVGGIRPQNNDIIHTVNWVNDERVVFEYAEKQSYLDSPIPTGELYAMNIDGSQRELIYGYRAGDQKTGSRISSKDDSKASQEIISFLDNDDDHILIVEYPWTKDGKFYYDRREKPALISRLNVYSGKKRKLEVLPYGSSSALANKFGDVKFMTWRDDNNVQHSAYRSNNDGEWIPLEEAFENVSGLLPLGQSEDGEFV